MLLPTATRQLQDSPAHCKRGCLAPPLSLKLSPLILISSSPSTCPPSLHVAMAASPFLPSLFLCLSAIKLQNHGQSLLIGARPFLLCQVMAASEVQGLPVDPREAGVRGVRGGIGQTDHEDSKDCILEPLSLPESPGGTAALEGSPSVPCIFCEEHFPMAEQDKLLKHMIIEHKIVIADVKLVADFRRYILYWRKRFTEQPITDFCSVIRINSTAPFEEQDNYYLLCDALPEDRILREELQKHKLKEVLDQQQRERNDTSFHGVCMFCSEEFRGNRSVLLNHMAREHAFNIGLPDNIVNCTEFLCTLQKKLDNLQCLYCEKTFRDKNTLKDHMRKKQHRRINPKNREYDRFYVINYLELGKSWEEVQSEDDRELLDLQKDDWSDWQEYPVSAVCLFCEKQEETIDKLYVHMKDTHEFDLLRIKSELGLNFYHQVKLVNFIRRQVHQCKCYSCHVKFKSKADLRTHMEDTKHTSLLPDRKTWDQLEYYFPTYENDTLLCTLSDSESDLTAQEQTENVPIISEDTSRLCALKQSSVLNQLLLQGCLEN